VQYRGRPHRRLTLTSLIPAAAALAEMMRAVTVVVAAMAAAAAAAAAVVVSVQSKAARPMTKPKNERLCDKQGWQVHDDVPV
jgi:hypothetical protein